MAFTVKNGLARKGLIANCSYPYNIFARGKGPQTNPAQQQSSISVYKNLNNIVCRIVAIYTYYTIFELVRPAAF
jgi:hypothetical protein